MLTKEQQNIVDSVCSKSISSNKIIAVNAIAGSGKTATAKAIIDAYNPNNGFYTAFNKAIVKDSARRFCNKIDCRTIHSLAYRTVKSVLRFDNIEELTVSSIKEDLDYDRKVEVISTLDEFFRSSSVDVYQFVTDYVGLEDSELCELVSKYAELMLKGKITPTFNFLLKCLHILLKEKEITIDKDLLIFDEMQDSTGVMLEIFKYINADRKVILGDKFQNIYSFMHTVNAFDELEDNSLLFKLTKSFRCNEYISSIVEDYGKLYLEENFLFEGTNSNIDNKNTVYLTRTNTSLIKRIYHLLVKGESFTLLKDINNIFSLPIAIINTINNRPIYDRRYKFLKKEYSKYLDNKRLYGNFIQYLNELDDININSAINALNFLRSKNLNIYELRQKVLNLDPDPSIILSTTHAYKGLEANTVYIEDDLNASLEDVKSNLKLMSSDLSESNCSYDLKDLRRLLPIEQRELLNLFYVALSRARTKIINYEEL